MCAPWIPAGVPSPRESRCPVEAFHGSENATALIHGLVENENDYPFLVILDGDYKVLEHRRSPHRHVIVLPRYSFENFLWEPESVNRACLLHARCGDLKDAVVSEMCRVAAHLAEQLLPLIILDVAARRLPSPPSVLPDRIDQLLTSPNRPDVDPIKVARIVAATEGRLDATSVRKAHSDVKRYLKKRCITHLLKGHLVLGILRRIFLRAAAREMGANCQMSNDVFTQLLVAKVWQRPRSEDHRALKRKVRALARKLGPKYAVLPASTTDSGAAA